MLLKKPELLERMLRAGKLKNWSELAKAVGLSPQAISNYKKKGEIPPRLIFKFAETYNISIDWLLTGLGEMSNAAGLLNRVCAIALVETSVDRDNDSHYAATGYAVLNSEEVVYVGKLLTILRCSGSVAVPAIKSNIDAFYNTVKP